MQVLPYCRATAAQPVLCGKDTNFPRSFNIAHATSRHSANVPAMSKTITTTNASSQENGARTSSAADAINLGLSLFKKGRVKDALAQFGGAWKMNLEPEEAQAALYNKACCHAFWDDEVQASDALRKALRDYGLKFSVILSDPDMAPFRGTKEFKRLQDEARKGGQDTGPGFRRDLKLIGEVQAPFWIIRKILYVVFSAAAGISTVINGPHLYRAFQGGENAPGLLEAAQNLGINIAGIIIFVALFIWDSKKEEEQIVRISRDESLSRLPLQLARNHIVNLAQLRETTRPLILAGKKETVQRAVQRAEKYRNELLKRDILLLLLDWRGTREELGKKKGLSSLGSAPIPENIAPGESILDALKWDKDGLVVAIAQHVNTGSILMQGFANRDAVSATIASRRATFYSRSRACLWTKGETSLNFINVIDIFVDCDRDSIIYLGHPDGPTCHTGAETCYFTAVTDLHKTMQMTETCCAATTLYSLEDTIAQRRDEVLGKSLARSSKRSWTKKLLQNRDLLCSKIREEADELCRTVENNEGKDCTASEMADVLYHCMVLLSLQDVKVETVLEVLRTRFSQSGIEEKEDRKK